MFLNRPEKIRQVFELLLDSQTKSIRLQHRYSPKLDRGTYRVRKIELAQQHAANKTRNFHDAFIRIALNPMVTICPGMGSSRLALPVEEKEEADQQYILQMIGARTRESVCYKGTMESLEQSGNVHISDPPCFTAWLTMKLAYGDADASPVVYRTVVEMRGLKAKCSTGLKMGDIMERIARGAGQFRIRESDGARSPLPAWTSHGLEERQLMTMLKLQNDVQQTHGWKRICRNPVIEVKIDCTYAAWSLEATS